MSLQLGQRVSQGVGRGADPDTERDDDSVERDIDSRGADWHPFRRAGPSTTLSQGEIYDVLRNSRRRAALSYLLEHGRASVREVTTHVAADEYDVPPEAVAPDQRKRVYTALSQCHLTRLDEFGVVEYDDDEMVVELADVPAQVASYLRDGTTTTFDRIELVVAWVVAPLAILGVVGVGPFGQVPLLAWALLTVAGLAVVASRQLYESLST